MLEQDKKDLEIFSRSEITEHFIYRRLAELETDGNNRSVLKKIAEAEWEHHELIKTETGVNAKPSRFKIWLYVLLARVFGLTFAIKLMEAAPHHDSGAYRAFTNYPKIAKLADEGTAV